MQVEKQTAAPKVVSKFNHCVQLTRTHGINQWYAVLCGRGGMSYMFKQTLVEQENTIWDLVGNQVVMI
jgi:hypothetical protein